LPEILGRPSEKIKNYYEIAYAAQEAWNFEEAYKYFTTILENTPEEYLAWIGKGLAAGYLSTPDNLRAGEVITSFEKAILYSPDEYKDATRRNLGNLARTIGTVLCNWLLENNATSNENLYSIFELYRYCESYVEEGEEEKLCWEFMVILSKAPVRTLTGYGVVDQPKYEYHYPLEGIRDEYIRKIRAKYDKDYLKKEERAKAIKIGIAVLISVILFVLLILCCNHFAGSS